MPTLKQVQDYIKNRRTSIGNNNDIDELKPFLKKLNYKEEDTQPFELFTFGVELGDGSDEDHFHIGMTSLNLLKNIEILNKNNNNGVYHLDATYKVIKYLYPLIVFGFTDINRKFYPIAFMYTSHEQQMDYDHFFISLVDLTKRFQIDFDPGFIVTDACSAMANSIKKQFPKCLIIMCYFHLRSNIKKQKHKRIPSEKYNQVMQQISSLHNITDKNSYESLLQLTLTEWKTDLPDFHDYFLKQWINSKFNNWQIFLTPPGFAHTNSPIESYNNNIKTNFTKRLKHHLKSSIEVFQEAIDYESNNIKEFELHPKVRKYMRTQAVKVLKEKKLVKLRESNYKYLQMNGKECFIDTERKICSCFTFIDKGVCKHLVAACQLDNCHLYGLEVFPKKLLTLRRKNRTKHLDDSLPNCPTVNNIEENLAITSTLAEETQTLTQQTIEVIQKSKRGRPKKITSALAKDNDFEPRVTRSRNTKAKK